MKVKLIYLILFTEIVFGSGGYEIGTATGKGKFQLDLTWNPFGKFKYGQTYVVMNYGITKRFDIHGYISQHPGDYRTWYLGLFYQFLNMKKLHLATAVGVRRRFDKGWTNIFAPQLLYTGLITERLYLGGSFVDVRNQSFDFSYGVAIDIGVFYKLKFETKLIESISIGMGGFHPATWNPSTYFLPTYSLDVKFK